MRPAFATFAACALGMAALLVQGAGEAAVPLHHGALPPWALLTFAVAAFSGPVG